MTSPDPGTAAAIIVAGGRARRLGGVSKPQIDVGGRTLLDRTLDAVSGCDPIYVVGPEVPVSRRVTWLREDPPFGGPAAALVTAIGSLVAHHHDRPFPEITFVLACDLPGVASATTRLESAWSRHRDADGVCLIDHNGTMQWLTALYRTEALVRVAGTAEGAQNASIRSVLGGLAPVPIASPPEATGDVDTWEDVWEARARFANSASTRRGRTP